MKYMIIRCLMSTALIVGVWYGSRVALVITLVVMTVAHEVTAVTMERLMTVLERQRTMYDEETDRRMRH